ncbi:MAG: hypothetical protein FJW39_21600 [Acidobacteria bacterium]|nr:hypothetical protein [Acidobacteriota bacterium]
MRPLHLSAGLVAACLIAVGWVEWRRSSFDDSAAGLARHLPVQDAVHYFIDVQALRMTGLLGMLAGSKAARETDYETFVKDSGFDYSTDLDSIVGALQGSKWSFLLRGRFDWDKLRRYAESKGGQCVNGFCSAESKNPGKFVSFFAVSPRVMALAVSESQWGAYVMKDPRGPTVGYRVPDHPAWITVSAGSLDKQGDPPDGMRAFANSLRGATRVTLSLTSRGDGFQAMLDAPCESAEKAAEVRARLTDMTGTLRKFLARAKQNPNPRELAGVLSAGEFKQDGAAVSGVWPIERAFLETLAEGNL